MKAFALTGLVLNASISRSRLLAVEFSVTRHNAVLMNGYNFIYKKLVTSPTDVVGALAYSLYKSEKVQYIEEHTKSVGSPPDDKALEGFHRTSNLDIRLAAYRRSAEDLLNEFIDDVLATSLLEEKQKLKDDAVRQLVEQHTKPRMWAGVLQNVIAGAITSTLVAGVAFGLWMYAEGVDQVVNKAVQKFTSQTAAQNEKLSK